MMWLREPRTATALYRRLLSSQIYWTYVSVRSDSPGKTCNCLTLAREQGDSLISPRILNQHEQDFVLSKDLLQVNQSALHHQSCNLAGLLSDNPDCDFLRFFVKAFGLQFNRANYALKRLYLFPIIR